MFKITSEIIIKSLLNFPLQVLIFLLFSSAISAQEGFPEYDELNVEMSVPRLGTVEIPIAIKGQDAYLPVQELFDFLKIKNEVTAEGITGFIIHPDSTYSMNFRERYIRFKEKENKLAPYSVPPHHN